MEKRQTSEEARDLIAEEEALLAHVLGVLERAVPHRRSASPRRHRLVSELKALRDEATHASVSDLPTLFQEMGSIRALVDRDEDGPLPSRASPYFAHLRLRMDGQARDFLLGRATYTDTASDVRIVDWRFAPVARIFYGYQEGDPFEEQFPGGMAEGVVEARRVVVIERGLLTRILSDSRSFVRGADGTWTSESGGPSLVLGGGTGTAARPGFLGVGHGAASRRGSADVTALLDAEQFQALSVSPDRPLLVLGSAGSGKTTVALHRLSKLAFDDRQRFPQSRMKVVVPEEGLARLARRLLAPLGMEKLPVETLAAWSRRAAIFELEIRGLKLSHETPPLVARLKRHPALREPLLARLGPLNTLPVGFHQLRRRLANEFTDRAFLTEVVMAARQDLPVTAVEETVRHTMLQLANPLSRELEGWDAQRIQAVDGQPLEEGTPDELAGTLDVEDLPLLLFLKAKRTGGLRASSLAHLVLDESEDFSVFELYVLGKLLRQVKSCTIAGDEMQQTLSSFAGWGELLDTLGVGKPAVCRLQVSYRCPRPVTELARKVLGPLASPASGQLGRDGVGVGIHHFPDAAQAQLFLSNALRDLVDREPRASVGVIASGSEQARALHRLLKEVVGARLVLEGEFSFDPGVDVTDVDNVKGLEFDYVIIPDATAKAYPATDDARRRLHVAITRTSHQLWVLSSGVQSPLLRG